jgi:hypothetical protein
MAEVRASPSNVVPDRVKRIITPQEILAAVAVGGIAFWAPAEDSGLLLRLVASVLSLGGLLLATVGLELLLEYRKAAELPKTNPFEVKPRRLEVPTAPPGGGSACWARAPCWRCRRACCCASTSRSCAS